MMFTNYFRSILLSCLFISCSDVIREPHSLEYKKTFDVLANDILSQNSIFEMDDFTRHHKSLNDVFIYLGEKPDPIDTLAIHGTNRSLKPLGKVLDSFKISQIMFDDFRKRLQETKLREFYKSNDSILFIVDGFLDNSWGFMYAKGIQDSNGTAFRFGNYTVNLLDSVNKNWRRVSIQ